MLKLLIKEFSRQAAQNGLTDLYEVLCETDDGTMSTGSKRNTLLFLAIGEYICYFDDDDWPSPDYLKKYLGY